MITNQLVRQVPLQLQGRIFATQLIVLPSQKIDIILGMSWMGVHRVILDTVSRSVHINSPIHGSMILSLMKLRPVGPCGTPHRGQEARGYTSGM